MAEEDQAALPERSHAGLAAPPRSRLSTTPTGASDGARSARSASPEVPTISLDLAHAVARARGGQAAADAAPRAPPPAGDGGGDGGPRPRRPSDAATPPAPAASSPSQLPSVHGCAPGSPGTLLPPGAIGTPRSKAATSAAAAAAVAAFHAEVAAAAGSSPHLAGAEREHGPPRGAEQAPLAAGGFPGGTALDPSIVEYFGGLLRYEQAERKRLEAELGEERSTQVRLRLELRDRQMQAEEENRRLQLRIRERERQLERERAQAAQAVEQEREVARQEVERLREKVKQHALCQRSLLKEVSSLLLEREALKRELLGTSKPDAASSAFGGAAAMEKGWRGGRQGRSSLGGGGGRESLGGAEYASTENASCNATDSRRFDVSDASGMRDLYNGAGGAASSPLGRLGRRAASQPPVARRLFARELGDATCASDAGAVVSTVPSGEGGDGAAGDGGGGEDPPAPPDEAAAPWAAAEERASDAAGAPPPEEAPEDEVVMELELESLCNNPGPPADPPLGQSASAPARNGEAAAGGPTEGAAEGGAAAAMAAPTSVHSLGTASYADNYQDRQEREVGAYVRHMQAFARRLRQAHELAVVVQQVDTSGMCE